MSNQLHYAEKLSRESASPIDANQLANRWRTAARVYRELEQSEAGLVDDVNVKPLTGLAARHIERVIETRAVRETFNTVPVAFGLVPLDRLIVSQYSITQRSVAGICSAFAKRPTVLEMARLCLPLQPRFPDLRLVYRSEREYVFVSDAHDMRFLGSSALTADQIDASTLPGHPGGVVALGVGFSTNLLNVVRFGQRIVLNNGHHRAFALLSMGVTHAPCLIQVCEFGSEINEAANEEICENHDLYFEAPRPPLLVDFLRPELTYSMPSPRLRRQVTVKVDIQSRLVST